MPYKTLIPGVQMLEKIGEVVTADGKHLGYEHKSVIYPDVNTVLSDAEVSPVVQKLYDEGDEHVRSVIERVDDVAEEVKPARRTAAKKAENED